MNIDQTILAGIEALPTPVFIKDFDGKLIYCNRAFCDMFGFNSETLIGEKVTGKSFGLLADKFEETDLAIIQGKGPQSYEIQVPSENGELRCLQIMKNPFVSDEADGSKAIVGVVLDITDRVFFEKRMKRIDRMKDIAIQINQGLLQAEESSDTVSWLLEKCMESIPDAKFGAILILDDEGVLRMPTTKGYPAEMVKNFRLKPENSLVYGDIGRIPKEICIVREIDKKLKVQSPELLVLEGERVKTSLVAPVWIDGKFYGFINIDSTKNNVFGKDEIEIMEYMRNQIQTVLSKQRKYQKELINMRTDSLTGLFNRGYIEEMAQKAIEFAKSSDQSMSLVITDIDGLKQTNDCCGHIAGDFLLKSFSQKMSAEIRDCDILGRFGGDEFVAIFPGSRREKINKKMEEIRNSIESVLVEYENKNLQLRFSFGVSEYPLDGDTFKKLFKTADGDMYEDKKSRKENYK